MSKRFCTRCHRYYPASHPDCPDCGPPWWRRPIRLPGQTHTAPGSTPSTDRLGVPGVLVGAAALIVLAIYQLNTARVEHARQAAQERAQADRQAAQAAHQEAADCRRSAKCWGRKHWSNATVACTRRADQSARYATRWPSGLLNPAFLSWAWRDQAAATLIYVGRVELQNGFGAWEPYIVGCVFDSASGAATEIELRPGRL